MDEIQSFAASYCCDLRDPRRRWSILEVVGWQKAKPPFLDVINKGPGNAVNGNLVTPFGNASREINGVYLTATKRQVVRIYKNTQYISP
jgi:hypothetical protein